MILAAHLTLLFKLQFRPTSTMSPTSWMLWALVLRTKCPPLRRPVPRPGGVVVLQHLHRPVQDVTLVRQLLLLVLQVLQVLVLLRPEFRSHATDGTLASTGTNSFSLVNNLLRAVLVPIPATPATLHRGVSARVAYHACETQSPDMIHR